MTIMFLRSHPRCLTNRMHYGIDSRSRNANGKSLNTVLGVQTVKNRENTDEDNGEIITA